MRHRVLQQVDGTGLTAFMTAFDTILRNGRVLTSTSDGIVDVGIRGGLVDAVGQIDAKGRQEIDCSGLIVTPGGVDVHCHIEQMSGMGLMNADTFESATRSAAMGGTTSVVSFAPQMPGQRLTEAMKDYQAAADRGAALDHAFHIILSDLAAPNVTEDLISLIEAGHRSIKVFTTYNIQLSDREICEVISNAKAAGALVCIHAENDGLIGWTKDRLIAKGKRHPRFHAISHPRLAEIEAVERMIRFAEFFATPLMLFHISTAEGVAAIRAAKARGVPVWAETCPHYLFMDASVLERDGVEGAKWMCSPPQRTTKDQDALWAGLKDGTISLISSDHAPYRFDETGKLAHGSSSGFEKIANGLPGLEVRMPLLFGASVMGEHLGPTDFVKLTASEPARIHGLTNKGDISVGKDADIVVWDPKKSTSYGENDLHDNVGYNPWVGRRVRGQIARVMLRGETIVENGLYSGTNGAGRWLQRTTLGVTTDAEPASEFIEATS